jgi:HSP20 family protein
MAETATKLPLKTDKSESAEKAPAPTARTWHPFESLHREIDRLFDDFSVGWPRLSLGERNEVAPFRRMARLGLEVATDVTETEKEYRVTAEIPGLDEKDVEVNLASGVLTMKGEKKEEFEESKKDFYRSERSYGAFQRSFRLPEDVDPEKIEASLKKGVLTVVLPKTAEAQKKTRKVEIKAK